MPVTKRKLKSGKVRVSTPGGVKSKATTVANANAQERLLNAIEHNPDFVPGKKTPGGVMNRTSKFREFQKSFSSNLGIKRKQ